MSDQHEVGYAKPPKHTQFQKGQSGNPLGRPRGSRNVLTEIRDELFGYVTTSDGTKVRKIIGAVKSALNQAMKGNVRAIKLLLDMIPQLEALEAREREDKSVASARMLQKAIRDTFMPVEERDKPELDQQQAPEQLH